MPLEETNQKVESEIMEVFNELVSQVKRYRNWLSISGGTPQELKDLDDLLAKAGKVG